MSVSLFVPRFHVDECLEQIRECLEKGWTGLGFKTVAFEKAWMDYTGLPFAHFLSSNTVGLHLAIRVLKDRLGWQDGDEIITTPLTFVSTNHAILYENLHPTFADVDEYLCLDPDSVRARITPKTRAVLFVGLGGNTGRYEAIRDLCREKGIALILDAAHMAGTRAHDRHVGHDADVTIFSFQAVKNLPTGDSGMICFARADDDAMARKMSWLGINKDTYTRMSSAGNYKWMYDVEEVGFKYHGNSIMAAIGLVELPYLDQANAYRRNIAALYAEALQQAPHIAIVPCAPDCVSSRHLFQVRIAERDRVIQALNDDQIYPGVHYRDNTLYRMYAYADGTCPNARRASDELLSLPMHLGLTKDDVATVTQALIRHTKP